MEWMLLAGTVIIGALAFWGLLGIWADSLKANERSQGERVNIPGSEMAEVRAPQRTEAIGAESVRLVFPTPVTVSVGSNVCVQCELYGASEEPVPALADLLEEEQRLAETARERGLVRSARLHDAIAEGVRRHLGELEVSTGQTKAR